MNTTTIHKSNNTPAIVTAVAFWAIAVFWVGYNQFISYLPNTTIGFIILGITSVLLLFYAFAKSFKETIDQIPLKSFAWLHAFRIIGGVMFVLNADKLPQEFVMHTGYGDIISGLSAIALLTFGQTKLNYWAFNTIGTLDLLNAMRLGFTLGLAGDDRIKGLGELPFIMIILFVVPILIFTHLMSFKRLIQAKNIRFNQTIQ